MLNLAEAFWSWKRVRELRKPFTTVRGYKVRQFGDKWAVLSRLPKCYKDLVHTNHQWGENNHYFRDCLKSKEWIEEHFGKILENN